MSTILEQRSTPFNTYPQPVEWLVIDIETGDAPLEAVEVALNGWKPPSNIKDQAKIEERRAEATAKIKERSALLDAAPILCVGVQTSLGNVLFDGMSTVHYKISGVDSIIPCGDEKTLLGSLRNILEVYCNEETVLVGHNVKGFDLPKLRNAYMRNRILLPAILVPSQLAQEQKVVDTAYLFKSYSVEHRDDFCPSLDSVCQGLGIPRPKSVVSGAEVPRLHREGRIKDILTYNAIDVAATSRAFLLMTGQAQDLA